MKKLNKKGQTEDFIADLIPSLIIIAIGLYVLSNMQEANRQTVEDKGQLIKDALAEKKTITDYLSKIIEIDNKKIPLREVISLSYKNDEYWNKVKAEMEWIRQQEVGHTKDSFYSVVVCLNAEFYYPDGSVKKVEEEQCFGEEKLIFLPTYEGKYITMKLVLGKAIGQGSSGV